MGIETALILGFSAFKAISSVKQAESQAEAVTNQANLDAANKSKEARIKAARVRSSFLNSGVSLGGSALSAIENTFDTGIADVNQITSNANTKAKNIISSARTEALFSFASSAIGAGFGGDIFGGSAGAGASTTAKLGSFAPESTLLGMNGTANVHDAYTALDIKDSRGF